MLNSVQLILNNGCSAIGSDGNCRHLLTTDRPPATQRFPFALAKKVDALTFSVFFGSKIIWIVNEKTRKTSRRHDRRRTGGGNQAIRSALRFRASQTYDAGGAGRGAPPAARAYANRQGSIWGSESWKAALIAENRSAILKPHICGVKTWFADRVGRS
jgi:hypothetical protein